MTNELTTKNKVENDMAQISKIEYFIQMALKNGDAKRSDFYPTIIRFKQALKIIGFYEEGDDTEGLLKMALHGLKIKYKTDDKGYIRDAKIDFKLNLSNICKFALANSPKY